jgi:hypothetical protein
MWADAFVHFAYWLIGAAIGSVFWLTVAVLWSSEDARDKLSSAIKFVVRHAVRLVASVVFAVAAYYFVTWLVFFIPVQVYLAIVVVILVAMMVRR